MWVHGYQLVGVVQMESNIIDATLSIVVRPQANRKNVVIWVRGIRGVVGVHVMVPLEAGRERVRL